MLIWNEIQDTLLDEKSKAQSAYLVRCYLHKNNSLDINVLVASGKGSWMAEEQS